MEDIYMLIGNRIKNLRMQCGYRQADLADLVGCSKQVISNIERNITAVSAEFAAKIASELHAPLSAILPDCADQHMPLSEDERSLIAEYRSLPTENRQLLREILNLFINRTSTGSKLWPEE